MNITEKDIVRFWSHVTDKNENGCRLWTGCCNKKGYGQFRIGGKVLYAPRVSYLIVFGEFPEWLRVLHHCDIPACVEPTHLWLGTDQDNATDKMTKGRHTSTKGRHMNCGENHPQAKLTKEEVSSIRYIYSNGDASQRELAKEFGVSRGCIQSILNGLHWII